MYDMYPWDSVSQAGQGDYPPEPLRSRRAPSPEPPLQAGPVQAVQVALDRRDNGGDGTAVASRPLASRTRQPSQPPASQPPASQPSQPPASRTSQPPASRTRQ